MDKQKVFGKISFLVLGLMIFVGGLAFTKPVFSQTKPCETTATGPLTLSPMDPISFRLQGTGPQSVVNTQTITIDFSQLEALNSKNISDYTEGNFQDSSHQQENIASQNSTVINYFFGASQKLTPQVNMDKLRQDYVSYVYYRQSLPEANILYTDETGIDPKTIIQLVQNYGWPQPPTSTSPSSSWGNNWGRYWSKIPTSANDQTKGMIRFYDFGTQAPGFGCVGNFTDFEIAVPEFTRLARIGDNLNKLLVPKISQSKSPPQLAQVPSKTNENQVASNQTKEDNSQSKGVGSLVKGALSKCVLAASWAKDKILGTQKLTETKKTEGSDNSKVLAESTNETTDCSVGTSIPSQGTSFCPPKDAQTGNTCNNGNCGPNPLAKVSCNGNQCTFTVPIGSCETDCDYNLQPVLGLPYLTEIWNQTTWSEENNNQGETMEKPGYFGWFTPSLPSTSNTLGANTNDPSVLGSSNSQSQPIASLLENRQAGKSKDVNTVLGAQTGEQVAAAGNSNSYQRYIGGVNNFRSLVQFHYLSPIPGGIYRPSATVPTPTPSPGPTPTPGPGNCPTTQVCLYDPAVNDYSWYNQHWDSVQNKCIQDNTFTNCSPSSDCRASAIKNGSAGDIVQYIACITQSDPTIVASPDVTIGQAMLGALSNESSMGDSCTVGGLGEIGVFQFMPGTWDGHGFDVDSGSAAYGEPHGASNDSGPEAGSHPPLQPVCWGNPGPDSGAYFHYFNKGNNSDQGAWNPYDQADVTKQMMLAGGVCHWCGFNLWYSQTHGGVDYCRNGCAH